MPTLGADVRVIWLHLRGACAWELLEGALHLPSHWRRLWQLPMWLLPSHWAPPLQPLLVQLQLVARSLPHDSHGHHLCTAAHRQI